MTAGLLLAAGAGRRFGGPKALVDYRGELLVHRGRRLLAEGGCDPVVIVLGAQAEQVMATADLDDCVLAIDWESGMGASLRTGLGALAQRTAAACVVALADQPLIGPGAVVRLREAHAAGAVAAVGDNGARPWLRSHPELVTEVPCDGTGSPFDVDTPDDLATMEALA